MDLAETADTDGLAHVDVAGDGGGADVEPVNVLGRKLVLEAVLAVMFEMAGTRMLTAWLVLTVSTQPVDIRVSTLLLTTIPQ